MFDAKRNARTILIVKFLINSQCLLMPGWQAEDAEDSAPIDDAYLDVRLVVESRALVELGALDKEGSHCLIRQNRGFGLCHLLPCAMKMLDDGTVKIPLAILGSDVLRKRLLGDRV